LCTSFQILGAYDSYRDKKLIVFVRFFITISWHVKNIVIE
jgi:hypothetical protein